MGPLYPRQQTVWLQRRRCPLCANSRREQLQQDPYSECLEAHSISSSANVSSEGGTVRPSALATLTLMTSSNLVVCSTGRSAGLAPFRILSTKLANRRMPATPLIP